jgi:hypothetical protein
VTYTVPDANDAVDGAVSLVCTPASGSVFSVGPTTVTCTATDTAENAASATFTVTVNDVTAPVMGELPGDIVVSAENADGAVVNYAQVSATDAVDGDLIATCNPASGSAFSLGTTTVTCTATDSAGNSASGSFAVTVQLGIIWVEPVEDPATGSIGPNFNFRWGYGADGVPINSSDMIDRPSGKDTAPLVMTYLGASCGVGLSDLVDLDAGKSSLRYSQGEWQLNWQTGQSLVNNLPLNAGCYELSIPRAAGKGETDKKTILLTE